MARFCCCIYSSKSRANSRIILETSIQILELKGCRDNLLEQFQCNLQSSRIWTQDQTDDCDWPISLSSSSFRDSATPALEQKHDLHTRSVAMLKKRTVNSLDRVSSYRQTKASFHSHFTSHFYIFEFAERHLNCPPDVSCLFLCLANPQALLPRLSLASDALWSAIPASPRQKMNQLRMTLY